ncbi:hydrolytic protein [Actinokineospora sp. NBRC 105648]|uniref:COG1470 family protein n=1 Tax=Actinokineospora sp. NBRC 105648 TaxID=3032206 RepID=UPI00255385FD|nr:hydrolytic protein [Actinokineospora sp. NBRC 105648]
MTTSAELDLATVTVAPGSGASTTLTVRNDTDIVEAYRFEPVGECAPWTTVEPDRVSLYPGTSETVTVWVRPPRSSKVRAGETPLGIRVLPVEHPELAALPETTVVIEPFGGLTAGLRPRRRMTWRGARFTAELRNEGNTPVRVAVVPVETGDELRLRVDQAEVVLAPDAEGAVGVRARTGKLVWFGKSTTIPFQLTATPTTAPDLEQPPQEITGEVVQLAVLPRWLLALLALLVALLLLWFTLVRPAVRSSAKEAAETKAQEMVQEGQLQPGPSNAAAGKPAGQPPTAGGGNGQQPGAGTGTGTGTGTGNGTGNGTGVGKQSSGTIEVRTGGGTAGSGTYVVPAGKTFLITDLVLANYQGDEGVLTVVFGDRVITTIALETFRNQDYHWVTPIEITENAAVTVNVSCDRPGTPASGKQAQECVEVLNVSGELRDLAR